MNKSIERTVINIEAWRTANSYVYIQTGKGYNPTFTDITEDQGKVIADFFELGRKYLQYSNESLIAYQQFKDELLAQYEFAVHHGALIVEPWLQDGQPYANSAELCKDVLENNRLYFFLTSEGFGDSSVDYSNHPLLEKTGIVLQGVELSYNDLFRIVHDYFGHCIYGFQFGPKGETNAWQSHLSMFLTRGSKLALSNEAQNQTCFYNFGKHLRREDGSLPKKGDSDYVSLDKRPYAEQAVLILDPIVYSELATI